MDQAAFSDTWIIVLCYNSAQDTLELLRNIHEVGYGNVATIVIDNASKDSSEQVLADQLKNVEYIQSDKNLGYAGGNNLGIRTALDRGAKYVWVLNPDIRVSQGSLESLHESIAKDEMLAAIGPRICMRDEPDIIFSDGGLIDTTKGLQTRHRNYGKSIQNTSEDSKISCDYVDGSSALISSSALENIGLMREDFFMYMEETEWCLRASHNGYHCSIDTNAVVYCQPSKRSMQYFYLMARNQCWLARMYGKAKQSNKPTAKTVLSITIQKFGELLESIRRKGLKAPKLNALIGTALGLLAGSFTSPRFGLQNSDNQAEQED